MRNFAGELYRFARRGLQNILRESSDNQVGILQSHSQCSDFFNESTLTFASIYQFKQTALMLKLMETSILRNYEADKSSGVGGGNKGGSGGGMLAQQVLEQQEILMSTQAQLELDITAMDLGIQNRLQEMSQMNKDSLDKIFNLLSLVVESKSILLPGQSSTA